MVVAPDGGILRAKNSVCASMRDHEVALSVDTINSMRDTLHLRLLLLLLVLSPMREALT